MSKPMIILADTDARYLMPIELRFIENLKDSVDMEVITDPAYFNSFFSLPRRAEILLISEQLYRSDLINRHDIKHVFILCEDVKEKGSEDLTAKKISKYMSDRDMFNQIIHSAHNLRERQENVETQVVLLYSAAGGAGKTTVAVGLSACLSRSFKKVLYVNAEYMQSFHHYITNKDPLSSNAHLHFQESGQTLYGRLKQHIRQEEFDYLPPLRAAIVALGIDYAAFYRFVQAAKASMDYDFIVVDVDAGLTNEKMDFLALADKVILVMEQDPFSVFKTEILLDNINCNDKDKYIFVCNDCHNYAGHSTRNAHAPTFLVSTYITYIENINRTPIDTLANTVGIQKLAYTLL